ncbi:MAG: CRISPR-associated endonuclease Cas2 [Fusobacteriia bacterium 4572_132]|nr:MAG: CRISPR-associated endonuclease Cas2 [Fusobacteriia bacterium 4572_132]
MLVWCIYDISKTKIRNKIVKLAQEHGLYRVQNSVFLGNIEKNDLDEIALQSEELINEETDSVYIFPMCKKDFKSVILQGQAFDKDLVSEKVKALFF